MRVLQPFMSRTLESIISMLMMMSLLLTAITGIAIADNANNGIWLQSANSGNQAWAYYPYDPASPLTGGSYSATNTGTSYFTVTPGTTIYRKYIVLNNEPYNDSVSFSVTGLPSGWGLTYTTFDPMVISYVYNPSVGQGAQNSHQGFGYMVVSVPLSAAPGTYSYTVEATSGTGHTSSLGDSINVGTSSSTPTPTVTPSPTVSAAPTITPTPTPSSNPTSIPAQASPYVSTPALSPSSNPSGLALFTPTQTPVPVNGTIGLNTPSNETTVPLSNNAGQTPATAATASRSSGNDAFLLLAGLIAAIALVVAGFVYVIRK